MLIKCLKCGSERKVSPSRIKNGARKFCIHCFSKLRVGQNHPRFGKKASPETIEKLRQSHLGKPGYWLGKTLNAKTRGKISLGHTGINTGKDHHAWKGEDANYFTKHSWMTRQYGQPKFCEGCSNETAKSYHWANISGKYIRDREDWIRLCQSCHFKMDRVGYSSWKTRRKRKEVVGLYC